MTIKNHIPFLIFTALSIAVLTLSGCTKDPLPGNLSKPTLNALYKDVSFNSVRLTCNISKTNFKEYGFWYGTKSNLSDKKAVSANLSDDRKYAEVSITNLESGKTYYFQAYVNSGTGPVSTSSIKTFSTLAVSSLSLNQTFLTLPMGSSATLTATVTPSNASYENLTWTSSNTLVATVSNGTVTANASGTATVAVHAGDMIATCKVIVEPEAVDLGLSVKWASCNVGSSSPSNYGGFFAWGETSPKNDYCWSTYKWGSYIDYNVVKYNYESLIGTVDNKTILDLTDDAARANLGSSWRMPTNSEIQELRNNCTWTWTTVDGKNGYRVTSNKNGNSIFLPVTGCRSGTSYFAGKDAAYWSSTLWDTRQAYSLWFTSTNRDISISTNSRDLGIPVRPVYGELIPVSSIGFNYSSLNLTVGGSATLTATIYPSNASDKTVKWYSTNTSVATVSSSSGYVAAHKVGTATIIAMAGGKTETCSVTVAAQETIVDKYTNYYGKAENNIYWYEDKTLYSSFNGPRLLVNYSNTPRLVAQATDKPNHFILDNVTTAWFDVNPTNKLSIAPTKADSIIVFNAIKDYFKAVASVNENAIPYLKFITGAGVGTFKYDSVRADKIEFAGLQMRKTNAYLESCGIHRSAPYDNKGVTYLDAFPFVTEYVDAFTNLIQLYNHYVHGDALTLPFYTAEDANYTAANYGIK